MFGPEANRRAILCGLSLAATAGLASRSRAAAQPGTGSPLPRWGDQGDGTFVNPIIPADYSDIDAIRVGDVFYAISSTLHMSPAMVVLRSTDMVNWSTIGHAVSDLAVLGEEALTWRRMEGYGRGMWAGAIRHHAGRYYIYFASPGSGLYVCTATDAAGPWSPPLSMWRVAGHNDCCPFWDRDGSAWLAMTRFAPDPETGERYVISLYRMGDDGLSIDQSSAIRLHQSDGSEANKLYRFGDWYYHYFSEVRAEGRVPMMARARSLLGLANASAVQLGHVDAAVDGEPNQGAFLRAGDASWWFLTHQGRGDWEGRAMCLLPVTWRAGWPIIGRPGADGIGSMVWQARKPIPSTRPALRNLADDFRSELSPEWEWNHAPRADAFSLVERPGWLRLRAFPRAGSGLRGAGNMLTQRSWRTADNRVEVTMDISGMVDGQIAGLSHLSRAGAWIGVRQANGRKRMCFGNGEDVSEGPLVEGVSIRLGSNWKEDGRAIFTHGTPEGALRQFGGEYVMRWGDYRGDRVGLFTYHVDREVGHVDFTDFTYSIAQQTG